MATFYRCDRCSVEKTSKSDLNTVSIERSYDKSEYTKELCQSCHKQLEDFIKPLPKKAPAGEF